MDMRANDMKKLWAWSFVNQLFNILIKGQLPRKCNLASENRSRPETSNGIYVLISSQVSSRGSRVRFPYVTVSSSWRSLSWYPGTVHSIMV